VRFYSDKFNHARQSFLAYASAPETFAHRYRLTTQPHRTTRCRGLTRLGHDPKCSTRAHRVCFAPRHRTYCRGAAKRRCGPNRDQNAPQQFTRYSITSSARCCSCKEISSPRALAVFQINDELISGRLSTNPWPPSRTFSISGPAAVRSRKRRPLSVRFEYAKAKAPAEMPGLHPHGQPTLTGVLPAAKSDCSGVLYIFIAWKNRGVGPPPSPDPIEHRWLQRCNSSALRKFLLRFVSRLDEYFHNPT
jgi:hypothetical protein